MYRRSFDGKFSDELPLIAVAMETDRGHVGDNSKIRFRGVS